MLHPKHGLKVSYAIALMTYAMKTSYAFPGIVYTL